MLREIYLQMFIDAKVSVMPVISQNGEFLGSVSLSDVDNNLLQS